MRFGGLIGYKVGPQARMVTQWRGSSEGRQRGPMENCLILILCMKYHAFKNVANFVGQLRRRHANVNHGDVPDHAALYRNFGRQPW